MILISSCLLGFDARYNGQIVCHPLLLDFAKYGMYIPVCPEQMGGLPTPRRPAEIAGGSGCDVLNGRKRVVDSAGNDVTNGFITGAAEIAKIVKIMPVTAAILKERSPSCGVHTIYDGSFSGVRKNGRGVTAEKLGQLGVALYSEEEISEELLKKLIILDPKSL